MELVLSVANLYYKPDPEEDRAILRELREYDPEGERAVRAWMSEWRREGYEEGIAAGLEKGMEQGKAEERRALVRKMLNKGFLPEEVAETMELSVEDVMRLANADRRQ